MVALVVTTAMSIRAQEKHKFLELGIKSLMIYLGRGVTESD